jgi:hypothetical protein
MKAIQIPAPNRIARGRDSKDARDSRDKCASIGPGDYRRIINHSQ